MSQKEKHFSLDQVKDITMNLDCINFLSTKICKFFITDKPTPKMINPIITAFKSHDGYLPEIHKATIKVVFENLKINKQLQTPENWLLQIVRMIDSNWPYKIYKKKEGQDLGLFETRADNFLTELGDHPYKNKDIMSSLTNDEVWLTPELLIKRLIIAYKLTYIIRPKNNSLESVKKMVIKNFDKFEAEKILKTIPELTNKQEAIQFIFNSTYGLRA